MSTLQLINEDKAFSSDVNSYLTNNKVANKGLDYHLISVFGSQSTGKSTLLNALFGTKFGVMDASVTRQQTTKGIWMGVETNEGDIPTIVLDVEGTDGRERGEDQEFERKAALFALATSEILIINMWENQIGLYAGANMALLRTVFEVNLSLFQAGHGNRQRSKLLFVIRDYIGVTPLEKLARTLREDLEKQWESLSKPAGLDTSTIDDFFDLDVSALPHKVLQSDDFNEGVIALRKKLNLSIKPEYHRNVPIDGWSVYAEKVWEQIEMNKDLDLPTHQILVSRFRCEEISDEVFKSFEKAIGDLNLPFGENVVIADFGAKLRTARSDALALFDETASRYQRSVYNEKRLELLGRVDGMLTAYFGVQLGAIKAEAISIFWEQLENLSATGNENSLTLGDKISTAKEIAQSKFVEEASEAVIDPSFYSFHAQEEELNTELIREASQARKNAVKKLLKRISRKLNVKLDHVTLHFEMYPDRVENPWDATLETLRVGLKNILSEYPDDLGLGGNPEETKRILLEIEVVAWKVLSAKIASFTTQDAVLQRMRDRFEESFRYTPEGLPVVWAPGDDIDAVGVKALKKAQAILPVYASAKLSNGDILAFPREVAKELQDEDEEIPDFMVLLTSADQQSIERRFQRIADSAFVDAKRSVMQQKTHIPMWVFVVIIVLGWNEFTAILRNPVLVLLVLIIGGGAYVVYSLGMADAVINVAESTFYRTLDEGKHFLRELIMSDEEKAEYKKKNPTLSELNSSSSAPSNTQTVPANQESDSE